MIYFNTMAVARLKPYMNAVLGALDPDARIAGGFVRDTLMDKPVRDMDILVSNVTQEQLDTVGAILGVEFVAKAMPSEDYRNDDDRTSVVEEVYTADTEDSVGRGGFDIIVVTNVQDHIREFPDNISRVQYGLDTGVEYGEGFAEGHAQKRIVYMTGAGPDRLDKLMRKFPDYDFDLVDALVAA